jgi:hypothetical protein
MGGATTTKECNGCATHHNHPHGAAGRSTLLQPYVRL